MADVTNYIDRLVAELCPDGVEYRPLGDVVEKNYGGGTPSKAKEEYWDGDIPWASVGDLSNDLMEIFDTRSKITPAGVSGSSTNVVPAGAVIVAIKIAPGKMKIAGVDLAINQDIRGLVLNDLMNARFLTYYFRTLRFAGHGTIVKSITNKRLMDTEVPVPPLEIQEAIVEILDKFTNLEAELEAELEARRTQYEHYRNHLLSYDSLAARGPVEMVKLGDVISISRGASPRPISKFVTQGEGIPWIKIGDVDPRGKFVTSSAERITSAGAEKSRKVLPGDFILSNSMSFGRPYILQIEGCVHDGWLILSNVADHWIPDFLYHSLRTDNVQHQFAQLASGGTVRNLNSRVIESVELALPQKMLQEEIVSLLDRFDALVNDISSGLPAEIAARRAQYEYYRDRLLSFPEKLAD